MSFSTLVTLAYLLFFVVQIYFTKKAITTIRTLFPQIAKRSIIISVVIGCLFFYLYPTSRLLHNTLGVDLPENRLMKASDIAEVVVSALKMSPSAVVEDIIIRPQLGDL